MTKNTASGLSHKYLTKLERPAGDKHSSLLQMFVNYGCKSFITLGTGRHRLFPLFSRLSWTCWKIDKYFFLKHSYFFWVKLVLDRGPEQRESKLTVLCLPIIIILISYIIMYYIIIKLSIMENHLSRNWKWNLHTLLYRFHGKLKKTKIVWNIERKGGRERERERERVRERECEVIILEL
jgi:hypothetical protein